VSRYIAARCCGAADANRSITSTLVRPVQSFFETAIDFQSRVFNFAAPNDTSCQTQRASRPDSGDDNTRSVALALVDHGNNFASVESMTSRRAKRPDSEQLEIIYTA